MKTLLKNRFIQLIVATILVLLVIGISAYAYVSNRLSQTLQLPAEGIIYEIPVGASLQRVATDLAQSQIIDSPLWVRLYARLNPAAANIRAGEYRLAPGTNLPQLLEMFMAGRIIEYPVKFLEGWNFAEVKRELSRQEKLEQKVSDLTDAAIMEALGRPGEHPEGMFFPDTYLYHKGMSDLDVLKVALRRMDQILADEWANKSDDAVVTSAYEALILASIIEKETGVGYERATISGVFSRRLKLGMRLQTDPTVIYGLGENYAGNLSRKHLIEETPYNTYKIGGLPPTPIALPGRDAIHAALHPEAGKSLFFVARGDGTHEFTETLQQHQNAVIKYQIRERRSDYRSRPSTTRDQQQAP